MRGRENYQKFSFQELKLWWEQLVESVKMEPEVYRIFNIMGVILIILLVLYTVGKILLFRKSSEPVISAIIPFVGIWTLGKLAWGSGIGTFLLLIPIIGFFYFFLTIIVLCRRFNGGIFSYFISILCPPLGIFILGITGKLSGVKETVVIKETTTYYDSNGQVKDVIVDEKNLDSIENSAEYEAFMREFAERTKGQKKVIKVTDIGPNVKEVRKYSKEPIRRVYKTYTTEPISGERKDVD